MNKCLIYSLLTFLLGCSPKVSDVQLSDGLPPMYPDYADITVPVNIAPLNFLLRDSIDAVEVTLKGGADSLTVCGAEVVEFSLSQWKELLQKNVGSRIQVQVTARKHGRWTAYRPFYWTVVADSVDAYLSYRLIEPGYEVWHALQLRERNVENFEERVIADNNQLGMSCMNCHIYGNKSGNLSMFHLRGDKGGTILNRDGKLRKLTLNAPGMVSGVVYGDFHPSGRWGVFSTNIIIPDFHIEGNRRLEVYDTKSDVVVVDFDRNTIAQPAILGDSLSSETFPCFSADGRRIYFCTAPAVALPDSLQHQKYSLCSVAFDAGKGVVGQVDTLVNARLTGTSVCHLKTSLDGNYLIYTEAEFGTFPIWHRETELRMLDLKTGAVDSLSVVNSNRSETYHSWSSNSRWVVFASKRGDGQYGKPYFFYVDSLGKAHKPFLLPQKSPYYYDETLTSFNIPDLSRTSLPFDAEDIESVYENVVSEKFE